MPRLESRLKSLTLRSTIGLLVGCVVSVSLCSCANQRSLARQSFESEPAGAEVSKPAELAEAEAPVQPPAEDTVGVVRISKPAQPKQSEVIQQVGGEEAVLTAAPVPNCPPGYGPAPTAGAYCPPGYGVRDFNPDVLRVPLHTPWNMENWAKMYPEEYIYDGGDRDYPVHYSKYYREGLDTEDTVAEYTDTTGERHTKPSNRVAVYAPRFAAVETITAPTEGLAVNNIASTQGQNPAVGFEARIASSSHQKNEALFGLQMDARPSGFEHQAGQQTYAQEVKPIIHEKMVNTFQDTSFVKTGLAHQNDYARLGLGMQAALHWTRDLNPVVVSETSSGGQMFSFAKAGEVVGVELKGKKGDLRIVKLADKKIAEPGDIITFTIRFDNLGDQKLYHIKIIDNLTPRLEFVEGSADSELPGRLDVEDNGEGSLVLKFILTDPLPGHKGGTVTFKTKVR